MVVSYQQNASCVASILWRFLDIIKTQALPIDRYQDAHTLPAKTQVVEIKSTWKRLGSSRARLWPILDLKSIEFTLFSRQNKI